jgi:hypothetical protein
VLTKLLAKHWVVPPLVVKVQTVSEPGSQNGDTPDGENLTSGSHPVNRVRLMPHCMNKELNGR